MLLPMEKKSNIVYGFQNVFHQELCLLIIFPPPETQRKLLKKLREWRALDFEEETTDRFLLTIYKNRFEEIYDHYERGMTYEPQIIGEKVLILIADSIANTMSHHELTRFFDKLGIPEELDSYRSTGSKALRLRTVMVRIAKDERRLRKVIEEVVHPLHYKGGVDTAEKVQEQFNKWLIYEGFVLKDFHLNRIEDVNVAKEELLIKAKPIISALRELADYYLRLMQVIDIYFQSNQKRDEKLNEIYLKLCSKIEKLIEECNIAHLKGNYIRPFRTLFSAQKEMNESVTTFMNVKNTMNAFYGEIQRVIVENEEKKIKETDLKKIDDYLEQASVPEREKPQSNKEKSQETISIRITDMPELKVKGLQEKVILPKGKKQKIQLRKFPDDTKWEDITLQFLNGDEAIVKVKDMTYETNFEAMGFKDQKTNRPYKQWELLKAFSICGGEISWKTNSKLSKNQIDNLKQQKHKLATSLKDYFQIEEDPFYDYKREKAYRIKIRLIPEQGAVEEARHLDIEEYLKE